MYLTKLGRILLTSFVRSFMRKQLHQQQQKKNEKYNNKSCTTNRLLSNTKKYIFTLLFHNGV